MTEKRFDQKEFNEFVINNNVIGFFDKPVTLKSGRTSHWYVNWRTIAQDAFLMNQLTEFIINFIKDNELNPDCFYGVPEGATKLGILTQDKWAKLQPSFEKGSHILAMGRAKPKEHGDPKDKYFVGMPKGNTIILEDVTTTGGSLITTIKQLQEADVNIIRAIGLTDRMEVTQDTPPISVKKALEDLGVTYVSLSNATQLLPLAYQKLNPGEDIAKSIESEFKEYGIEPLKII